MSIGNVGCGDHAHSTHHSLPFVLESYVPFIFPQRHWVLFLVFVSNTDVMGFFVVYVFQNWVAQEWWKRL